MFSQDALPVPHSLPRWHQVETPCFQKDTYWLIKLLRKYELPKYKVWSCFHSTINNSSHLNSSEFISFQMSSRSPPPLTVWLPASWQWLFFLPEVSTPASQAEKTPSSSLKRNVTGSLLIAGISLETWSLKGHHPKGEINSWGQGRRHTF